MERPLKKEVWISIKGIQKADGEDDVTELDTLGNYYRKDGTYYITYSETETTGYAGCFTTLKVEGDQRVSLIRYGASRSNLMVERDRRNIGYYGTTAGEFMIGVNAHEICSALDDNGGDLSFSYSLDVNASHISDNEVYIQVKPVHEPNCSISHT